MLAVNNYTADNIGDLNPIRYRSYYYDVETGLYYLQSRYYDPDVGRFINADTTSVLEDAMYDINGLNLYAYCDNNPVAGRDDEGDASFWKKLAVAVAVVAVVAVVAAAVAVPGGAFCAAATVLMGAAKGAVIGAAVGAATGAVVSGVQGAVEGYKETGNLDGTLRAMGKGAMKGAVQGAADGFVSGLMMGGISTGITTIANGYGTFCFVAGTTVLTTLGNKAIETIEIGDTVPCVDHITGEFSEKKVVTTTVNKVNRLIELDIDGEIIQCTETHPFQVKGKGWVDAANLAPTDVVYTKDWNTATVKSVSLLELDEPVEVFNFEVEDCHTYFVGDGCILVHNASCHLSKEWRTKRSNYWKEQARNGGNDTWYDINYKDNYSRMLQGKAPIGYDNKRVVLHHVEGIAKNIDNFVEIGADAHRAFHNMFGYKNFIDIFVL